eukprot:759550-Hanusia_phi.AAC.3
MEDARLRANMKTRGLASIISSAMRKPWYQSRHREAIMAIIPEIAKRLIQFGSTDLAKFILIQVRDLPSITAVDLWTIGTTFASNEMRDYDNSVETLSRAVNVRCYNLITAFHVELEQMGQKNAIPAFLSALQTTCAWEQVASYLDDMKRKLKAVKDAHPIGINRSNVNWRSESKRFLSLFQLGNMQSSKAASLLNQHKLHVIVNLNGWSGEDRNDILLHRPAMIILNALGYAGTSG